MITCTTLKQKKKKRNKRLVKNLIKKNTQKTNKEWINREQTGINCELFQKHFTFQKPSDMLKAVYVTNDKSKNDRLVNVIKSGLSDLKNEFEDMGEEEKQIKTE